MNVINPKHLLHHTHFKSFSMLQIASKILNFMVIFEGIALNTSYCKQTLLHVYNLLPKILYKSLIHYLEP